MPLYFIVVEGKKNLDDSHVTEVKHGPQWPPRLRAYPRAAHSAPRAPSPLLGRSGLTPRRAPVPAR